MALSRFRSLLLSDNSTPSLLPELGRLLAVIAKSKDYAAVVTLSRQMAAADIPYNTFISNILINAYINLGRLSLAFLVFGRMLKTPYHPNVVTFNILLRGLCRKADSIDDAVGFFRKMVDYDCPVNVVTLTTLLKGLVESGQTHRALLMLRQMDSSGVGDCQPNVVTFNIVVDGLCKNRLLKEAMELFQVMKNRKMGYAVMFGKGVPAAAVYFTVGTSNCSLQFCQMATLLASIFNKIIDLVRFVKTNIQTAFFPARTPIFPSVSPSNKKHPTIVSLLLNKVHHVLISLFAGNDDDELRTTITHHDWSPLPAAISTASATDDQAEATDKNPHLI